MKSNSFNIYSLGLFLISSIALNENYFINYTVPSYISQNFQDSNYINGDINENSKCISSQGRIKSLIADQNDKWSISVIDDNNNKLIEINADTPRIPASNQKLLTTSYALDQLGSDFYISTNVRYIGDSTYTIEGNGDPDFGLSKIQGITSAIRAHHLLNLNNVNSMITIILYDLPTYLWWPDDWSEFNRKMSYGAPITKLALFSNASDNAITTPIKNLTSILKMQFAEFDLHPMVLFKNKATFNRHTSRIIHREYSAPMNGLLSLTNSESHNFIAEVLLRHSSKSWDVRNASFKMLRWLKSLNLDTSNVFVSDGSGLSRMNKVTTNFLSSFLNRISSKPYFSEYLSSLAISGIRGTLRGYNFDRELIGNFYGKTGSLSDVRSMSGFLRNNNSTYYISIISNGASNADLLMQEILNEIYSLKKCL